MPIVHDPKTGKFMRSAHGSTSTAAEGAKLGAYKGHEIKMYRTTSEGHVLITSQRVGRGGKAVGPEKIHSGATLAEAKAKLRKHVQEANAAKRAAKRAAKPEAPKSKTAPSFAAKPSANIPENAYVQGEHAGYKLRNFGERSSPGRYTLTAQKGAGKAFSVTAESREKAFEKISTEIYKRETK